MGCDTGRDEEQPVHRVWVDAFLLGVFPVRNRDYEPFLRATGHPAPPLWSHADFNHPGGKTAGEKRREKREKREKREGGKTGRGKNGDSLVCAIFVSR